MRITRLMAGALVLAAGCWHPRAHVPHPLDNQVRYLCCNLHYDKPEITDMNFLHGKVIPFGTRVQIRKVDADRVEFETPGHPKISLVLKQGAGELTMDQYLDRIFLVDDPYTRLPKLPDDGKAAAEVDRMRRLLEEGDVTIGMTRDQVLTAIGYPPAHRTPRLDAAMWTYWVDPEDTFEVYFEGDRVSRVQRHDKGRGGGRRRPWG
jgi:hypothetical protein